jgi:magnesium transporter
MVKTLTFEKNTVREGKFTDLRSGKLVWADLENPDASELSKLEEVLGLSETELNEYLKTTQRPTLFNLSEHSVIIFDMPVSERGFKHTSPVTIFVSKKGNDFVAVHKTFSPAVKKIYAYNKGRLQEIFKGGVALITLTLLEEIIDSYFIELDDVSDQIEDIEKQMFDYKNSGSVMKRTFAVKKSLIFIHKALVANREVVSALEKQFAQFLDQKKIGFYRELNADITQLIEMTTTYRDIITSAIEIHLSSISNNLNVTMKKVTSWGAIILVPSLVAGIFGMNFRHIPTLDSPAGFFVALLVMILASAALTWYFKKKDWL